MTKPTTFDKLKTGALMGSVVGLCGSFNLLRYGPGRYGIIRTLGTGMLSSAATFRQGRQDMAGHGAGGGGPIALYASNATHKSGLFTSNDEIQPFLWNVLHPAERQLLQRLHGLALQHRLIRQIIPFFSNDDDLSMDRRILMTIAMELQRICYPLTSILLELEQQLITQDARLVGLIKYNTLENTFNLTSISLAQIEYTLKPWS
ncbi:hypothetical protein PCK1_002223 [Pneumocystis canis]|nr:hypothetical protein PCK1_002223 [Pneumocystis canis]